ncbi:MAG: ABC transporter permease [Sedimentisphaerales bacterium]|nr:ABC transporter permease [Sedimentisphaerales bacterium]
MSTLTNDVKYGIRQLRKNPGFSFIVVMLVAIGVGANTAVFSIFNAFLIRPLPYDKSDRIALVYQCNHEGKTDFVSYPNYLDWRHQAKSFDALACYLMGADIWRTTNNESSGEYVTARVSSSFFQVFGTKPSLGRLFSEEDERPSAAHVVVISDAFWRRHFGADRQVIGKTIFWLQKIPCVIVGVTPPDFRYPAYAERSADVWLPIALREGDNWLRVRDNRVFKVLGRLKAGVEAEQAQTEMRMIGARLADEYPLANAEAQSARVVLLQDHMASGKRQALALMMGAVAFVFLVACVNLIGLLFARGVTRERELAVRSAMGAPRLRLVRQLLIENLILTCLGSGLGVLGAAGAIKLLMRMDMVTSMLLPEGFFRIDMRVLGFVVAISAAGVPLVSLLPSICCAGHDLARTLAAEGRSVLGSGRRNTAQMSLVGTEIALTIVLLVAAGLMIRSLVNVITTDPGFNPKNILTMDLWLDDGGHRELLQRLQGLPGVEKAALAYPVLGGWNNYFCVEGQPVTSSGQAPIAAYRRVTSDYFEIMGIRLLQGRFFNEQDHADSSRVAIIDETLAKRYWPNGDAVGKRIQPGKSPEPASPWLEIVGVVGNTKNQGVEADSQMQIYWQVFQHDSRPSTSIVLRTSADPTVVAPDVREVARQFDWRPRTVRILDETIEGPSVMHRLITLLLAIFAGITLFLSAIGIYAITRYWVSCRTQEFGIRVALGATKADVLRLVFRKGLTPVFVGASIGLVCTLAATRLLSSLLFQLSPWDPATYAGVTLLLVGVAMLACYIPARRAAKVDPMEALRYE